MKRVAQQWTLVLLAAAGAAHGQYVAELVVDANTDPSPNAGSVPQDFYRLGDTVFFVAATPEAGRELMATDDDTTVRLFVDFVPGPAGSSPRILGSIEGRLVVGTDSAIWSVDPSSGDRKSLQTFAGGEFVPNPLAEITGRAIFLNAADGQLWSSDGSAAGTLALGVFPYRGVNGFSVSCALPNGLLFEMDGADGHELWHTDGTPDGQARLAAFPSQSMLTGSVSSYDDTCYLTTSRIGGGGWGLVQSDGTPENTSVAAEWTDTHYLVAATAEGPFAGGVEFGYFSVWSPGKTWMFQGVVDYHQPTRMASSRTHYALSYSSGLGQPTRVIVGDGSGPRVVTFEGAPLELPEGANSIVQSAGDLLFAVGGNKTYRIDPEQATATLIADAEAVGRYPGFGRNWNGIVYASGRDDYGLEPWRSDGTAAGTWRIADLMTGGASGIQGEVAVVRDDILYFGAVDHGAVGEVRRGLWRSDGTAEGTRELDRSLYGDGSVYSIQPFAGGIAFATYVSGKQRSFLADPELTSAEPLWPEGWPGESFSYGDETLLVQRCRLGGQFDESYCALRADDRQQPLWLGPEPLPPTFRALDRTINHAQMYFRGGALWRTDGTAPGTFTLAALVPWPGFLASSSILSHEFDGQLYFHACTANADFCGLYVTDGTAEPQPLASIRSEIGGYTVHAGELAFLTIPGSGDLTESRLWLSGGTRATTRAVADIPPSYNGLRSASGLLHFLARRTSSLNAYFVSDGTQAGTREVPLTGGQVKELLAVHDGNDVLASCDLPPRGIELCVFAADGSGLQQVVEIAPGELSSSPRFLAQTSDALYLGANDGVHGVELWRVVKQPDLLFADGFE